MLREAKATVIETLTYLASAIASKASTIEVDRTKLAASAAGVLALSSVAALTLVRTPSSLPPIAEASVHDGKSMFTPVKIAAGPTDNIIVPTPAPTVRPITRPTPLQSPRELAASIETELARAGCYDGEPKGRWSAASRQAMRNFTREANARLPVDRPDAVLFALVSGNPSIRCTVACAEPLRADDACAATTPSAKPRPRNESASLESTPELATSALARKPVAPRFDSAMKPVAPVLKDPTPTTTVALVEPPTRETSTARPARKAASASKSKAPLSKARRNGSKGPSLARSMKSLSRTLKLVFF